MATVVEKITIHPWADWDKDIGGTARVRFIYKPTKEHREDEVAHAKNDGCKPPPARREITVSVRFSVDNDDVTAEEAAGAKAFCAWLAKAKVTT